MQQRHLLQIQLYSNLLHWVQLSLAQAEVQRVMGTTNRKRPQELMMRGARNSLSAAVNHLSQHHQRAHCPQILKALICPLTILVFPASMDSPMPTSVWPEQEHMRIPSLAWNRQIRDCAS